jgi:integrase
MRWKDIDLLKNEIYIPQTNTKTEVTRTVAVSRRLRKEFEILWEASSKDLDSTVFGITSTIKTSFRSACEEAGIVGFRFHDCRHTATTRMIASGSPHTEVMKITGHSQLKTFLRYLRPETTNRVASNLDTKQVIPHSHPILTLSTRHLKDG